MSAGKTLWMVATIYQPKEKQWFIKHTARFGAFHGNVTFTDVPTLARLWTREQDALRAAQTANYVIKTYGHNHKHLDKLPLMAEPSIRFGITDAKD